MDREVSTWENFFDPAGVTVHPSDVFALCDVRFGEVSLNCVLSCDC